MRPLILLLLAIIVTATAASARAVTIEMGRAEQAQLLNYARQCMLSNLTGSDTPAIPTGEAGLQQRACFVTFFAEGRVVACFGSFSPRYGSLHEEIAGNVKLALRNDPRAAVLTMEMAQNAKIQITFPEPPIPLGNWRLINPAIDGLLVERSDGKGVAIVPGEAKTASYAWRSALRRLGLKEGDSGVRIYRFKAGFIRSGE